jgi:hypothetical protein
MAGEPRDLLNIIVDESIPPDRVLIASPRSGECRVRGCDHVHEVWIDIGPAVPSSKEPTGHASPGGGYGFMDRLSAQDQGSTDE